MTITVSNVQHIYMRRKTSQAWRRAVLVALGSVLIAVMLWVIFYSLESGL
jgi:hypothetical protein